MTTPGTPLAGGSSEVVRSFLRAARTLVDDYDLVDLAQQLVESCVEVLAVDGATLLLTDARDRLQVLATAGVDDPAGLADPGGVCDRALRAPEHDAAGGAADGVHPVVLRLRRRTVGVLALRHDPAAPLPAADVRTARGLADVATVGILNHRLAGRAEVLHEQLQTALNTRATVEQASGVLAELLDLDVRGALAVLRAHCREQGLALTAVARAVVERRADVAGLSQTARALARGARVTPGDGSAAG